MRPLATLHLEDPPPTPPPPSSTPFCQAACSPEVGPHAQASDHIAPKLWGHLKLAMFFWPNSLSEREKWKSLSCVRLFAIPWQYSSWNYPGQNTGVGSISLLQGIFPTQGANPGLPHCRWILYQLSHKGSPIWTYGHTFLPTQGLAPWAPWLQQNHPPSQQSTRRTQRLAFLNVAQAPGSTNVWCEIKRFLILGKQ